MSADGLPDGPYDHLITDELAAALSQVRDAEGRKTITDAPDSSDSAVRFAAFAADELRRLLSSFPKPGRIESQRQLVNELFAFLRRRWDQPPAEQEISEPAQVLRAVFRESPPPLPASPLSVSSLLTPGRGEPSLGRELCAEVSTADSIDALVSFVTRGGFRFLQDVLQQHAQEGRRLRLLTTTYTGATQADAVEAMARLPGAEVRVSFDGRRSRLHAKAWLFHRASGLDTAYVGSANLSRAALVSGHEWMVKVSARDLPHVIAKFRGAFESLWEDPEFESFDPEDEGQRARLRSALGEERRGLGPGAARTRRHWFQLRPYPFQREILERLEVERELHGSWRNLVVAATGTGKTVVAAFDYQRQIGKDGLRPRLLFLAHRQEILRQALDTFRHLLRDESFGELLTSGVELDRADHLFATVQSFTSRGFSTRYAPDFWSFMVVDECHHVPAKSYRTVMEHLRPRVLLGLTATPERSDGRSLLPDFGNRIASELRIWRAIARQLLTPFEYYGVHDGVDLRALGFRRGGYVEADLERVYTADHRRADLIIAQLHSRWGDPARMCALGFCVSVEHAEFMASRCSEAGIPAAALHGGSSSRERDEVPRRLQRGEIRVIFTCDLYNEGVDLPFLNTLLLLRPTQSSTLFLQQLGRGLRLHEGKSSCLVLDFIGQHRREFRFAPLLTALTGLSRGALKEAVSTGFPHLPPGCHLQLDKVARRIILDNLQRSLRGGIRALTQELVELCALSEGEPVTLKKFLEGSGRDVDEVYRAGGWTTVRRRAGVLTGAGNEAEAYLSKRLGRLCHLDDPERIDRLKELAMGSSAGKADERLDFMLAYQVLDDGKSVRGRSSFADRLAAQPAVQGELLELCDILYGRIPVLSTARRVRGLLHLHAHYTRNEILAAVGLRNADRRRHHAEGVLRLKEERTEFLLVTLDKSGKHFSPTTRYEDYAISERLFHWQTQSASGRNSTTGRNYIDSPENGWSFELFVNLRPGQPYAYLGPGVRQSDEGDRPISIVWRLEHPIPGCLLDDYTSLAAA